MNTLLESAVVTFQSTTSATEAQTWLNSLTVPTVACDFESASRYTEAEKAEFTAQLETASRSEKHVLLQRINSDGLSHPSLSQLTHFSLAYSESEAYVFILDNPEIHFVVFWEAFSVVVDVLTVEAEVVPNLFDFCCNKFGTTFA